MEIDCLRFFEHSFGVEFEMCRADGFFWILHARKARALFKASENRSEVVDGNGREMVGERAQAGCGCEMFGVIRL